MYNRRYFLTTCGVFVFGGISGCIDTFSGGQFVGGADRTQLNAQRGAIVETYDEAITERNEGVRTRDEAIQLFNDGSYERAIGRFETGIGHFQAAESGFAEAASKARELGVDEAATICETAEEDATLQIDATEAGLNAAKAANGQGTSADVNEYVGEYRDLVEQAEEVPVEDPQTLVEVIESG